MTEHFIAREGAEPVAHEGRAHGDHIEVNADIMGGTPVIRGTRMTVYAVLGRLDHGETVEDILDDNPHLSQDAIEVAAHYARAHPLTGHSDGRPWTKAA